MYRYRRRYLSSAAGLGSYVELPMNEANAFAHADQSQRAFTCCRFRVKAVSAVSDEQGAYRFSLLPPGAYTVRFALQGFGTVVREGVTLTPGFTSNLNISMSVASVAETITVVC